MSGPSGGGAERKKSVAPSGKKLSMLAQYDELTRMAMALCKGDEEEFINILDRQEAARKLWVSFVGFSGTVNYRTVNCTALGKRDTRSRFCFQDLLFSFSPHQLALQEEHERCELSISAMERDNLSLETQLKHARNQIELEMERRKRAEREREALESQIGSIRELLVDKKDNSIMNDIDRDKLFPVLNSTYQSPAGASPAKRAVSAATLGLHLGQGGPPPLRASTATLTTPRRILDTIDESSNSILDDDISYDKTLDDDLDGDRGTPIVANFTVRRSSGRRSGRKSGKRPSAPTLEELEEGEEENAGALITQRKSGEGGRKKRKSHEKSGEGGDMVVVDCTQATPHSRRSATMMATTPVTPMSKIDSSPNLHRGSTILRTPSTATLSPGKGLSHPHTFVEKTIVRMETCQPCGKRITFGKTAAKCRDCKSICHLECRHLVPVPCIAAASAGGNYNTPKAHGIEKG